MSSADWRRQAAAVAMVGMLVATAGWLGPAAVAGGWLPLLGLALLLAPLALGLRGLLANRLRTGRWLSLVLPFYGAAFLVGAIGNPAARAWVTAGAFCVVLAFGATVSWVKRTPPGAPPR